MDQVSTGEKTYFPMLVWGQSKDFLFLSVKLMNIENPKVDITEERLSVVCDGIGAAGKNLYAFDLNLYHPVITKESRWELKEKGLEIALRKEYKDAWPRLTYEAKKLTWVKFDFDRFQFNDSDEEKEEEDEVNYTKPDRQKKFDKKTADAILDQMDEGEALMKLIKNPLTIYMLLYNIFQWAGYIYVFGALLWTVYTHGSEGKTRVYAVVIDQLIVVQLASCLELCHAAGGWVKSSLLATLMQVCGRNLVLFLIVLPEESLHNDEAFFWLVLAWSSIEVVRYPYYLLAVLQEKMGFLTYLRYTLWIPFYPLGFLNEGRLLLKALPLVETSGRLSVSLPNASNMAFNFAIFLYLYIPCTMVGFYLLMTHMYKQRRAKLGPNPQSSSTRMGLLDYLVNTLRGGRKPVQQQQQQRPLLNGNPTGQQHLKQS